MPLKNTSTSENDGRSGRYRLRVRRYRPLDTVKNSRRLSEAAEKGAKYRIARVDHLAHLMC